MFGIFLTFVLFIYLALMGSMASAASQPVQGSIENDQKNVQFSFREGFDDEAFSKVVHLLEHNPSIAFPGKALSQPSSSLKCHLTMYCCLPPRPYQSPGVVWFTLHGNSPLKTFLPPHYLRIKSNLDSSGFSIYLAQAYRQPAMGTAAEPVVELIVAPIDKSFDSKPFGIATTHFSCNKKSFTFSPAEAARISRMLLELDSQQFQFAQRTEQMFLRELRPNPTDSFSVCPDEFRSRSWRERCSYEAELIYNKWVQNLERVPGRCLLTLSATNYKKTPNKDESEGKPFFGSFGYQPATSYDGPSSWDSASKTFLRDL